MLANADIYALWLCAALPPDNPVAHKLVDCFGSPEQIYLADGVTLRSTGLIEGALLRALLDKSLAGAQRIMESCLKLGVEVTHPGRDDYPPLLEQIAQPPIALFYRGDMTAVTLPLTLAIVGSRASTEYGLQCADSFAGALAACGITIVSGLAVGADSAAHEGAIAAGGRTVAVMPTGHDRVYPMQNIPLYERILDTGGAVLSEYYPGCQPERSSFVVRNRIVSGLSYGVLIVEAGERSGALATARHASEQERDVFAIPGRINSPASAGTNKLIKTLSAQLVTDSVDILSEYIALYPEKLYSSPRPSASLRPQTAPLAAAAQPRPPSTEGERRMLAVLSTGGDLDCRLLSRLGGLIEGETAAILDALEGKGYIERVGNGKYRAKDGPDN